MTLTEALRAAALHVEEHKAALAWGGPEVPSDENRARIIAEVSALGHELDSLAAASETAQVYPREVEAVRRELQARGLALLPEIVQAIAAAFLADAVARADADGHEGLFGTPHRCPELNGADTSGGLHRA